MYRFKDFETGKPRWTKGKFVGWKKGGRFEIWYAIFETRCSVLWIPEYLLTKETKVKIGNY